VANPSGKPGGWWRILYELAAVCQVDPDRRGRTLRELVWMSHQRGKHEWQQTALLASILINANRDPKKQRRPVEPSDLNPYEQDKPRRRDGIRISKQNRAILKKLFTKKGGHVIGAD